MLTCTLCENLMCSLQNCSVFGLLSSHYFYQLKHFEYFVLQDTSTSSVDKSNSSGDDFDQPMPVKRRRVNEAFKVVILDEDGYESPNEETEYFRGNEDIPILRRGKPDWGNQQLADLLLNRKSSRICSNRPLAPQETCSFLIDTSKLGDTNDWKADDHGSWRNCGSSGRIVTVNNSKVTYSCRMPRSKGKRPKLRDNQHELRTTYFRRLKHSDFKRRSIIAYNCNNMQEDLVIIEYFFTGSEHHVSPAKHGNAKSNRKFIPTAASTKKRLASALSNTARGPLSVFDTVSEEVGGIQNTYAASDLPRSVNQVWHLRHNLRQKGVVDQIAELLDKAHSLPDNLHSLQLTPSIRFVVSTPQTIENMDAFCTSYGNCTPFCIDTTYGVGDFFVTTTSYKNLKLLNKRAKEHPFFPGPALFHVDQDETVFSYFAQTLISQKNHLKSILFVGSDRDKALVNGTAKHFHIATNLFCKEHLEDDIMRKFTSIPHLTADMRKTIMTDIFGSEIMRIKGLIDCESEAQFEDHCYSCYRKWDTLERSNGGSIIPQFSSYFKTYIEQDMKQGALLFKCRLAGLGDNFFYNNSTESVNFRFKNKIRQKKSVCETSGRPASKCSLAEAVKIYTEKC